MHLKKDDQNFAWPKVLLTRMFSRTHRAYLVSASHNGPWLRWAAVAGIIAPVLFTVLILAASLVTPGYNQFSQTISELGQVGQPYALLQDANFVVTGLLIICFVIGLRKSIAPSRDSGVAPVLVLAYPIAFVLVGTIIPLPSPFHVPAGVLGFFVTLVGMIIASWPMRRDGSWHRLSPFTLITGIVSVGGFLVYGFLQSQGLLTNWLGLVQRLELAPFFAWVEVLAVRLYSVSKKRPIEAVS